jgi:hypothetical protein
LEGLAKQVKLVCTDLVAVARSRPTVFLEITLSGVRECFPSGVVSPRRGWPEKRPFDACHLIALKLTFRIMHRARQLPFAQSLAILYHDLCTERRISKGKAKGSLSRA